MIARLGPGLLQDDLIRLVANRLGMSESVTQDALRRVPRGGARRRRATVAGTRGRPPGS